MEAFMPTIISIAAAVFALVGAYVVKYLKTLSFYTEASAERLEIFDLISQGVRSNTKLVDEIKAAAADGKLTDAEKARLRIAAIEYAQNVASPELKAKLIAFGRDKLETYIEQALVSLHK